MSDWADEKANEWLIRHSVLIGFYGRESTSGKPLFDSLAALLREVTQQAEAKLAEALTLLRRVEIEGSEEITTAHAARRDAEARLAKVVEWANTAHAWGCTKPEGYSQGYADAQAFVRDALAAAQPAPPEEKP